MKKIVHKIYYIFPPSLQLIWNKIKESDIGNRIARGTFWSLIGSAISQGLIVIASIIVARILGKTEFGEFGMIRSTVNMFAIFAGFGLGLTATKYVAEFHNKDKLRTGKIIGLSILFASGVGAIISILLLIAAPIISIKIINAPHLINEIRLSAVMLFFSALNGAYVGTLTGYEAFKTIAKVNIISGLLAFPIQIGFALFLGLPGAVIGFVLNLLILWILNFMAVRKESNKAGIIIQFKSAWDEWRILYKFSVPALLSGILVSPVMWVCNIILVNQPNGYEELAIFTAANQWRLIILFIPSMLAQIMLPILSSSVSDQVKFKLILKINLFINLFISLIIAIGISFFAGIIMKSYGEGFFEGKTVLIVLSLSTILISISNVIGQAIAGKGKMWIGFILNFIWSIILLVSTYSLINLGYGAKGLAYGLLISYSFHTCIAAIYTSKYLLRNNSNL